MSDEAKTQKFYFVFQANKIYSLLPKAHKRMDIIHQILFVQYPESLKNSTSVV